eukprot:CAMPEP_0180802358 /NCGR_PEP_ID=MMETSP1038_2-20121128/60249_1 /TAXON_ID=632150 /ORGANISM="Azadinium spinosum, Strain 3D9" /LENGTH=34 /DNA_ID= /DNA_START= /DNA_END= /DNA_ORIENTATION=
MVNSLTSRFKGECTACWSAASSRMALCTTKATWP